MAVLSDADRQQVFKEFMSDESARNEQMALVKADLRAAFNAADDWVDGNAVSFNNALPQPARTALTARQKALLLAMVLQRRYGVTA